MQRINGVIIDTPDDNYIEEIKDTTEIAWKDTLNTLEDSQKKWLEFLRTFDDADFEQIYPQNNMTYYEHIHGIIQHDAYHLGQIVLLAKQFKI